MTEIQQKQTVYVHMSNVFIFLIILLPCLSDPVITKYEHETAVMTFSFENVSPNSVVIEFGNGNILYQNGEVFDMGLGEGNSDRFYVDVETYGRVVLVSVAIDDVSRNDGGTYFCLARHEVSERQQRKRASLMIRYPPGEAHCEIVENNDVENRMEIVNCSALKGNIPGKFVCFQDGEVADAIPRRTERDVNEMRQDILKKKAQSMQCCSAKISTHIDNIDIEECNDSILPAKEIPGRFRHTTASSLLNDQNRSEFYDSPEPVTNGLVEESVHKTCDSEWNLFQILILSILSLHLVISIVNLLTNFKIYKESKQTSMNPSNPSVINRQNNNEEMTSML